MNRERTLTQESYYLLWKAVTALSEHFSLFVMDISLQLVYSSVISLYYTAIHPICHGVFLTFVVMGGGGFRPPPPLLILDSQMVEVCCFCQQIIHFL